MGLMSLFKKKDKSILKSEDVLELREMERVAYLEEAKKLVVEKGKADAKRQIIIKNDQY